MVSYRLIGTGTTNAQGIARCSNNYVGTGKGEVDIVASTDNPITEGSLQSETFVTVDGMFYDKGLDGTGNHNDNWTNRLMKVTRTSDYTLLEEDGGSYSQWTVNNTFTGDLAVEFDYHYQSNLIHFLYVCGTSINLATYLNTDCHIKATVIDGKLTVYKDNTVIYPSTAIASITNTIRFQINDNGGNIGYSNFVVYPI